MRRRPSSLLAPLIVLVALVACGSGDGAGDARPTVVVTTDVLGDVVARVVGEDARVEVVMPTGTDPHEFQPSARQVNAIRSADALVTNGGGFEAGLTDAIEAAEGDVPTVHAVDLVETLPFGEGGHAHEEDDEHADGTADGDGEAEGEAHDHDHGDVDPHVFTDPDRMADVAAGLAEFLADAVPALDSPAATERADEVVADLHALADDVETTLAAIPDDRRVLVTNHDVFGYFADRYRFEVVGVVVPGGGTGGEASGAELDALAEVVRVEGVPAIFADVSAPTRLADALAAEVGGDVEVVGLFTESLGGAGSGAETYDEMMRTNAERIAEALA